MNIHDAEGYDLDQLIGSAMGHIGPCEIAFHISGEIAMQLFILYGVEIKQFADGFYATMRKGPKQFTANAKTPSTAIYRAYCLGRLGDNNG